MIENLTAKNPYTLGEEINWKNRNYLENMYPYE